MSALAPHAWNKAFVPIAGKTLVERTIAGLRSAALVAQITVVAPAEAWGTAALANADHRRLDGERISDSLRSGLADFPPDELVLLAASDLPVLSGAAVDDFVEQTRGRDPDLAYGCVERRDHIAAYPTIAHTWARLRGGTYCGAGLFAIRPRVLSRLLGFMEDLGSARKAPLRLAAILGWRTLASFALGRLSLHAVELRASALLDARAIAVVSRFPEIAVNVDRAADVIAAESLLLPAH